MLEVILVVDQKDDGRDDGGRVPVRFPSRNDESFHGTPARVAPKVEHCGYPVQVASDDVNGYRDR